MMARFRSKDILMSVILLCISNVFASTEPQVCVAESDHCSCKFTNGSYVSLWTLNDKNSVKFPDLKDSGGDDFTYEYNPCTVFSLGTADNSDCDDVVVCQVAKDKSNYYSCGYPTAFETSLDSDGNVVFSYQGGRKDLEEWQKNRKTKITLKCDKTAKTPKISEVSQSFEDDSYSFTVTSKCACAGGCKVDPAYGGSKGLSVGSTLLIVTFVLLIIYLVCGILFNKYKREKTGSEMIPNKEFWSKLPGLVKEGLVFKKDKICKRNAVPGNQMMPINQ